MQFKQNWLRNSLLKPFVFLVFLDKQIRKLKTSLLPERSYYMMEDPEI